MSSTPQHSPSHVDALGPIAVYGLHHAGPIEVTEVDGSVHVALGDHGVYLDRRGADDLLFAVAEAIEATAWARRRWRPHSGRRCGAYPSRDRSPSRRSGSALACRASGARPSGSHTLPSSLLVVLW